MFYAVTVTLLHCYGRRERGQWGRMKRGGGRVDQSLTQIDILTSSWSFILAVTLHNHTVLINCPKRLGGLMVLGNSRRSTQIAYLIKSSKTTV